MKRSEMNAEELSWRGVDTILIHSSAWQGVRWCKMILTYGSDTINQSLGATSIVKLGEIQLSGEIGGFEKQHFLLTFW